MFSRCRFSFSPGGSPHQGTSKSPAFLFSLNSDPSTPGFSGFRFDVGSTQDEVRCELKESWVLCGICDLTEITVSWFWNYLQVSSQDSSFAFTGSFFNEKVVHFYRTALHLYHIQCYYNKNTKLCSSLCRKPQNQSLQAVSIKSDLFLWHLLPAFNHIMCMILQALSSCFANQSKVKISSLPSPPRALRPLTETTLGMISHFHSTFES